MTRRANSRLLSARQFQCLQGVADLLDSEQIGSRLGISKHTVDSHIAATVGILAASSRRDAVRKYVALQQSHPEKVTGQFLRVASDPLIIPSLSLPTGVREAPAQWPEPLAPAVDSGSQSDDLASTMKTIATIVCVAAGFAILLVAIEPLAVSAMHLANLIQPFHLR